MKQFLVKIKIAKFMQIEQYDFYGLKISNYSIDELFNYYDIVTKGPKTIVCYGYSFGILPFFKKYKDLYRIINNFDINVIDGTQFYWFVKLMGYKLKTFLSIPFLTIKTLEYANENKKSVLLLGADIETNKTAIVNLKAKYPNALFFDGKDGYFSEEEEREVVNFINKKRPNILLIGISSPKKERFADKYKNELTANIIIPCGGMIDVFAGKVKLAPPFLKKIGLATLIRVVQEPRRQLFLNIWLVYETLFKIIPYTIFQIKIKRNKKFTIPNIYGIGN